MKTKKNGIGNGVRLGEGNKVIQPAMALTAPVDRYKELLGQMMQRHTDGVITLERFTSKLPAAMREGALEFLQKRPDGTVIAGRRGHESRFVFGPAFDKWIHQEEIRAEWRKRNGRDPQTGALLSKPARGRQQIQTRRGRPPGSKNKVRGTVEQVTTGATKTMSVRVTVGDQQTVIPVKLELVTGE